MESPFGVPANIAAGDFAGFVHSCPSAGAFRALHPNIGVLPVSNWLLNRNAPKECVRNQARSIKQTAPCVGVQYPPPAGSPKNHSPRRGPTILGGTFGARVKVTSLPRQSSSADYATCRHAPRPKGEQRARGCVPCELRSALTRSAPVAPPRSERTPVVSKNASNNGGD